MPLRLAVHILALLALLIQCSPVRACAFQSLLTGTSCHDGETAVAGDDENESEREIAFAADGCVPHPLGSHDDEACACEQPRMSAGRAPQQVVVDDFLPAAVDPHVLRLDPRAAAGLVTGRLVFESPPSVGRSLPLLI
ncbi:MAG: hypothetical protein WBD40_10140 [Tepidisphaeraceae bacterium]